MRLPKNTLRTQHLRTYGNVDLELDDQEPSYGCPRVYKTKYVDFSLKEPRSYALEYGTVVHDALFLAEEHDMPLIPDALEAAFVRSEVPLPPEAYQEALDDLTAYMERGGLNLATVAVEQELTMPLCEINGEQYWFGGRLDWIGIDTEDPTTLYYADYKTNRSPPSQAYVDRDNQFTGYGLLVRANLEKYMPGVDPSEVRIVGIMAALKFYDLRTEREDWQYEAYEDWLRAMCRKIVLDEAGDPILNPGCSWCPIKFDCPEFKKLPGQGDTLADRMSRTTDFEQRVAFLQQAQNTMRALKSVVDDVKAEIEEEVQRRQEPIVVGKLEYKQEDAWKTDWDPMKLHEVLGARFYGAVNVVAGRVEEIGKRDAEIKNQLEACRTKYVDGKKVTAKVHKKE